MAHILWLIVAGVFVCGCSKKSAPPQQDAGNGGAPEPVAAQAKLATVKLWAGAAVITAEVAIRPVEIQTGMMFRTNIVEDQGMLFVFSRAHQAAFWMKNCPKPLSCAYIDPQGVILEIHEMEPHNTNSITASSENVMFVLETARGWFERHGVRTNMIIQTERGPLRDAFFGGSGR